MINSTAVWPLPTPFTIHNSYNPFCCIEKGVQAILDSSRWQISQNAIVRLITMTILFHSWILTLKGLPFRRHVRKCLAGTFSHVPTHWCICHSSWGLVAEFNINSLGEIFQTIGNNSLLWIDRAGIPKNSRWTSRDFAVHCLLDWYPRKLAPFFRQPLNRPSEICKLPPTT